jgi:hypothetical protein
MVPQHYWISYEARLDQTPKTAISRTSLTNSLFSSFYLKTTPPQSCGHRVHSSGYQLQLAVRG